MAVGRWEGEERRELGGGVSEERMGKERGRESLGGQRRREGRSRKGHGSQWSRQMRVLCHCS